MMDHCRFPMSLRLRTSVDFFDGEPVPVELSAVPRRLTPLAFPVTRSASPRAR